MSEPSESVRANAGSAEAGRHRNSAGDRVLVKLSTIPADASETDDEVIPESRSLALVSPAPEPPSGAVLTPPAARHGDYRPWFVIELVRELHEMLRMHVDPRYRISRTAQFGLPGIVVLFVLNYFLFSVWFTVWFISPVAERLVGVLLAIFFYKLMTREVSRYRDVLAYIAKYSFR